MNRKLSTALVLALVLALVTSVVVFAQGESPSGAAPQDGTGFRRGQSDDQGMARQGTGTPNGAAVNYVDEDGDGVCDHFVDADGDGVCDNCNQLGSRQMARRGGRNQDGSAGGAMRRGGGWGRNR